MERFISQRGSLIAQAEPGLTAARALSALTDEAVRDLTRTASSSIAEPWALIALGGWGSGALLPASDLDLLVLSEAPAPRLKPFVEAILYPLWDAGLKVGHQVRSPKQQLRAAREDLKSRTAGLTGRPLAGAVDWADEILRSTAQDAWRRRNRVVDELSGRTRTGTPYLLEPDLKEGVGGRRDYDELTWVAAILEGSPRHSPHALLTHGVLTRSDLTTLEDAAHVTCRLRWLLHREGFGDRLTADAAVALGAECEDINAALGATALVLNRARARIRRDPHDPALSDAQLDPTGLFDLLDGGESSLERIEHAAQAGRLDGLFPGFSHLMGTRRPGLGHRLTVGAHSLHAAVLLDDTGGDPRLAASLSALADLRTLRVATLSHDAGKLDAPADHPEKGAPLAAEAARRCGLSEEAAHDASELVRLHLALIETALSEDLDDEDAILRCAARIGDTRLLAPLHLLTAADSRATGPATWTPWVATLVAALVSRIDTALSPDTDGAGLVERAALIRSDSLSGVSPSLDAEKAFIEGASLRYLASRLPDDVVRDAHLVASLTRAAGALQARVAVTAGPATGTHTVTVAAMDRPKLLARIAGALALAGLDILSVDAYATVGRIALDRFVVHSSTERPVTTETFAAFERLLEAALRDRLEIVTRLNERRRHYPPRSSFESRVEIERTGWDTLVSIETPDRPGLLHDLANAVSETGLDIRWARVQTLEDVARDNFHVVGEDGGPIDDPGVLGHLSMRIRELL